MTESARQNTDLLFVSEGQTSPFSALKIPLMCQKNGKNYKFRAALKRDLGAPIEIIDFEEYLKFYKIELG